MAGLNRVRRKSIVDKRVGTRTTLNLDGSVYQSVPVGRYPDLEVCYDVVGNRQGDNPFDHTSNFTTEVTRVNGQLGRVIYRDVPCDYAVSPYHLSLSGVPIWIDPENPLRDPTNGIASNCPSDPQVELPNFLWELKDIPDMLQHAGLRAIALQNHAKVRSPRELWRYLRSPRARGEDWLNYVFGWKPFFSDLRDLAGINDYLSQRFKDVETLKRFESRYLSKRTNLGGTVATTSKNTNVFRGSNGRLMTTRFEKTWAVAKWQVDDPILFRQPLENYHALAKQALGLDFNVLQLYNAIPWSWLVDWFANVQDIIKLRKNRFGVSFKSACVMTETLTQTEMNPLGNWGLAPSGRTVFKTTRKLRRTFRPTFFPTQGGLNGLGSSQLTTLASLLVTRGRGSSKL